MTNRRSFLATLGALITAPLVGMGFSGRSEWEFGSGLHQNNLNHGIGVPLVYADGVHDDTEALQRILTRDGFLNAGVNVPRGTLRITDWLLVPMAAKLSARHLTLSFEGWRGGDRPPAPYNCWVYGIAWYHEWDEDNSAWYHHPNPFRGSSRRLS